MLEVAWGPFKYLSLGLAPSSGLGEPPLPPLPHRTCSPTGLGQLWGRAFWGRWEQHNWGGQEAY